MWEGPHQEPATASPSLQAQPCLEVLTVETEPFTEGLGQETLQSSGSSWTVAESLVAQRPGKLRLISRSQWMGMAFSRVEGEHVKLRDLGSCSVTTDCDKNRTPPAHECGFEKKAKILQLGCEY